jgi:hypothetical protein
MSRNEAIRTALLPLAVRLLSTDKVPNVRMAAIQALISAKPHLISHGTFEVGLLAGYF